MPPDHAAVPIRDTEADTCRKYVVPKLLAAGWDSDPHSIAEQRTFTDGRIIPAGKEGKRRKPKRADYILRYTRDFPLAVVEAKSIYATPGKGLQQAKDYAEILGLKFAFGTNGQGILEFDFLTGIEKEITAFPTPAELWQRLRAVQGPRTEAAATQVLTPSFQFPNEQPRYYQEIAINRAVQSVVDGDNRILLTMATGTGKTVVAFQICWKLWNARWNAKNENRKPRILYLADRNILIDDPKDKRFTPFGEARYKIGGEIKKSREMYFAIYQAIAKDERRPGLYKEYAPDFFDLIIVDECHRGAARDTSNWREILNYFKPAYQIGMTATPLRDDNRDTYLYFGNPIYTYSLRQGIDDGFLAPYRVHRVVTSYDAAGWRPSQGDMDRFGREIPDDEYETKDFERVVALRKRTEAIAKNLTEFMTKTDRFAKTIVFCVDQEHADEMRRSLNNLNSDLVQQFPNYVCRVTADEGDVGRGHLGRFQEPDERTPVILTTSQLLTTGVDAPTCKNVVLARVVGSMTEFKQIIGRGTRVRSDYGKLFFNILDYTGSATRLFADPSFDGDPVLITEEEMDEAGNLEPGTDKIIDEFPPEPGDSEGGADEGGGEIERRKYYFDGGQVEIAAHLVYDIDPNGKQLRVVRYTEYAGESVRTLFPSATKLREQWLSQLSRGEVIEQLEERGIDLDELRSQSNQPEADPFDLICHLAYNAPLRTRRERAQSLKKEKSDFFAQFGKEARFVLEALLEKYAVYGAAEFELPDVLHLPPINQVGTSTEIMEYFGGPEKLKKAVDQLQSLLYAS